MFAALGSLLFPGQNKNKSTLAAGKDGNNKSTTKQKFKGWSMPEGLLEPETANSASGTSIVLLLLENTINDRFAIVLDNVFTKEECAAWAERAEQQGYEVALLNRGAKQSYRPDIRYSDRCVVDDVDLATDLFQRIRAYLPARIRRPRRLGPRGQIVKTSAYELTGVNERLRFLKYNKGGYFRPHMDGTYCRPDGSEMSWITVVLYFNDTFEGGRTCLVDPKTEAVTHPVDPKPGRAFIFEHDLYHVGEEVTSGTKLCARTDIMYREVPDQEPTQDEE